MSYPNENMIVGLFQRGQDAEDAVVALKEQGFAPGRIGAAFLASPSAVPSAAPASSTPIAGGARRETQSAWFGRLRDIFNQEPAGGLPPREYAPADFETSLTGLGIPSARERALVSEVGAGGAVVTVHADGRERQARETIERHHGRIQREDTDAAPKTSTANLPAATEAEPGHIQLFGEVLRVHKERVEHGEVRVRKEKITEMRTVELPVTREQLVVERSDRNSPGQADGEIRIPLNEERVSVGKETALLGEYRAGKRETTSTENVEEKVRREQLVVDDGQLKKS